jgi:hypothetical protein
MESSLAHTKWDCVYHVVWIPKSQFSDFGIYPSNEVIPAILPIGSYEEPF